MECLLSPVFQASQNMRFSKVFERAKERKRSAEKRVLAFVEAARFGYEKLGKAGARGKGKLRKTRKHVSGSCSHIKRFPRMARRAIRRAPSHE
jgi:hypothetical protein